MSSELSRRRFLEGLALSGVCGPPSLSGLVQASSLIPAEEPGNTVVDTLSPAQRESGLVTRQELALVDRWLAQVTNAEGGNAKWVDEWLGAGQPFSFQYRGQSSDQLLKSWKLHVGDRKAISGAMVQELVWDDPATGLRVRWQIKQFTSFPAVDWVLHFENKAGGDTPVLENIQALDLSLQHSLKDQPYTVHGALGGRLLPDDMMPFSWILPDPQGVTPELLLGGDAMMHSHLPFFNLETPEQHGVLVGVGWSGNWMARLGVHDQMLRARAGLTETHFVLRPGESVRSPRILLLMWKGKRLHGHNMLRRLLHESYVPRLRGKPQEPLVTMNAAFAYHGDGDFLQQANAGNVMPLVKPLTELGAEVFLLDAGWYEGAGTVDWRNGIGDWRPARTKYPEGFRPISDPLAAANIAFGLWFATENATPSAPVAREHPEFIRKIVPKPSCRISGYKLPGIPVEWYGPPDSHPPEPRLQLRMEIPEVQEWFLSRLDDLVRNQGLSCYREDQGPGFGEDPPDRVGVTESQCYAGIYALLDTIRSRYPNMVMEASGILTSWDLEALSRFHYGQFSDRWFHTDSNQCTLYGHNLYMPGGLLTMFTQATDDYGTWSSFAGQFSMAWDLLEANFPMEQARRQVERYKRIRRYLSGDFYPLTPCSLDEEWIGYQFHRLDLDQGVCLIFRRHKQTVVQTSDTFQARLRGLRSGDYRVRHEGRGQLETVGSETLAKGTEIVLREAPSAELMVYERIG